MPLEDLLAEDMLATEARNPASEDLDRLDPAGIVAPMNAEDARVGVAVGTEAAAIARTVERFARWGTLGRALGEGSR